MAPTNLPEMFFYRIEQCQEIQIIGKVPFKDYDSTVLTLNAKRVNKKTNKKRLRG